ncbi:hypothetical protein C7974DRAFT_476186 [Boeremia exigua]|uniref:uncharacterized protein n=1 Tax=Boeremia exigua TaxID=749465 RepID=UPI001E8E38B5|nr:uncharacterized protein C7974DRAFT_476186 [Boeremia exigua]KAH6613095.1 hypothetical protein C7974DRAFT_476186 [Boeremia exigua]
MPTLQCALLMAPLEVRNEIYTLLIPSQFHMSLQGDSFCLARCIEPRQDRDDKSRRHFVYDPPDALIRDEDHYRIRADEVSTPLWALRLESTWGPHWKCKEAAINGSVESRFGVSLLLLCRRIQFEVIDLLCRTAEAHVTDMETINYFHNPTLVLSTMPSILPSLLQRVTQLNITLRLPLPFFQRLERLEDAPSPDPELESLVQAWLSLGSSLRRFPNLRIVRFWLDHDKPDCWTTVNERTLLSPLARLFQAQKIDVSFSLPHLHPKREQENRQFIQGADLRFALHRRLRQRYFRSSSTQGKVRIIFKATFPFLVDAIDLVEMTMAEIEEEERSMWEVGLDVEDMIAGFLQLPASMLE